LKLDFIKVTSSIYLDTQSDLINLIKYTVGFKS